MKYLVLILITIATVTINSEFPRLFQHGMLCYPFPSQMGKNATPNRSPQALINIHHNIWDTDQ